jgi:peptidoglycan/LPS O-acetylase OafA/YrhL
MTTPKLRHTVIEYEPYLDGLRALAIFLVVSSHFGYLKKYGFLGVDIFFVISGFLMTKILIRFGESPKFIKDRIIRLVPLLYSFLSVAAILKIVHVGLIPSTWYSLLVSGLFFKNFYKWGNGVDLLWTLSAEMQFYLFMNYAIKPSRITKSSLFVPFLFSIYIIVQVIGIFLTKGGGLTTETDGFGLYFSDLPGS